MSIKLICPRSHKPLKKSGDILFSNEGNEWKQSKIFIEKNILKIKFRKKFLPRRGRINCSLNDDGVWRWFGVQYSINKN